MKESCFVVMAIGDQSYNGETVTAASQEDAQAVLQHGASGQVGTPPQSL